MISSEEVHEISRDLGVPLVHVEKDYVMGWILAALYEDPTLSDSLVLKGGNCLRKAYFSDTRFSDDLDFTAQAMPSEADFREALARICGTVEARAGIPFKPERIRVEEKATPDPDAKALDGRIYFSGFAGDSSLTFRLKFDVSDFETIVLPIVSRPLIHGYSDSEECACDLRAYALEEVLAEKLRSWIQRTRPRDLFDAVKIVLEHGDQIRKRTILDAFLRKTIFKGIQSAGRDELLVEEKFEIVRQSWLKTIVCPKNALIMAAKAVTLFTEFVEALFALPELERAGYSFQRDSYGTYQRFATGLREAIIAAGRARQTILMSYHGREREVEPYSFRYRVRKSDGTGHEYFYGFDRTRGQIIKSFFVREIASVSPTGQTFTPQYPVEF